MRNDLYGIGIRVFIFLVLGYKEEDLLQSGSQTGLGKFF